MTCSRLVGWVPRLGSGRIYHDGSHHQDCNSFGRKSPKKHLLLPLLLVGGGDTSLTTLMKTQATVNSVGILLINYERPRFLGMNRIEVFTRETKQKKRWTCVFIYFRLFTPRFSPPPTDHLPKKGPWLQFSGRYKALTQLGPVGWCREGDGGSCF